MTRQDYYPVAISKQVLWLHQFAQTLVSCIGVLHTQETHLREAIADALWLAYVVGPYRTELRRYAPAATQAIEHAQTGHALSRWSTLWSVKIDGSFTAAVRWKAGRGRLEAEAISSMQADGGGIGHEIRRTAFLSWHLKAVPSSSPPSHHHAHASFPPASHPGRICGRMDHLDLCRHRRQGRRW